MHELSALTSNHRTMRRHISQMPLVRRLERCHYLGGSLLRKLTVLECISKLKGRRWSPLNRIGVGLSSWHFLSSEIDQSAHFTVRTDTESSDLTEPESRQVHLHCLRDWTGTNMRLVYAVYHVMLIFNMWNIPSRASSCYCLLYRSSSCFLTRRLLHGGNFTVLSGTKFWHRRLFPSPCQR